MNSYGKTTKTKLKLQNNHMTNLLKELKLKIIKQIKNVLRCEEREPLYTAGQNSKTIQSV